MLRHSNSWLRSIICRLPNTGAAPRVTGLIGTHNKTIIGNITGMSD